MQTLGNCENGKKNTEHDYDGNDDDTEEFEDDDDGDVITQRDACCEDGDEDEIFKLLVL